MEIQFQNTMKDFIKMNEFMMKNSKSTQRSLKTSIYIIPTFTIIYFVCGILLGVTFSLKTIFLCTLICIVYVIEYPKYFNKLSAKNLQNRINELKDTSIFDKTKLLMNDNGLTLTHTDIKITMSWNSIEQVGTTDEYIFIHSNYLNRIVIPVTAFTTISEKEEFLNIINKHYTN